MLLVLTIILVTAALLLLLTALLLAGITMTGRRQTMDEAMAWQSEHYDTSFYDACERETYTVTGAEGYELQVELLKSPGSTRYMILSHGYTDTRAGSLKYARFYLEMGFSCIIYDLRGHGENAPTPTTYGILEAQDLDALITDTHTRYPDLTVPAEKMRTVKDGETLSLGRHELKFVFAPMVHWPEVMFTYDSTDKVLFSADAFGKFGALDVEEDWACEARRYYFGIVGKYGQQVQAVLKKAAALDIQTICPLHGPVLTEDLGYYLGLYQTWSTYGAESEGICIAYTSVYGHTKEAVEQLAAMLTEKGCPKVAVTDLARDDMAEAVEDAFRYGTLVLASTTYNNDVFPFMRTFIEWLTERNYQNKRIGIIENGSWAPTAGKTMKGLFEKSKNITFMDTTVTIKSALNDTSRAALAALADELMA